MINGDAARGGPAAVGLLGRTWHAACMDGYWGRDGSVLCNQ